MNFELIESNIFDITLPEVQCIITSPPYFKLRDYGHDQQLGQENTVEEYVHNLVKVFNSLPLSKTGTLFLNLGDSYIKGKLAGVPWRTAIALSDAGWYLRNEVIWHRNRVMPESAKNRFTRCHEHIFFLTKIKSKYTFNAEPVREIAKWANDRRAGKGRHIYKESRGKSAHTAAVSIASDGKRHRRSVWTVETSQAVKHHATYPVQLVEICLLAGSDPGDIILDPFSGTASTGVAALKHNRDYIGVEVSKEYNTIAKERLSKCVDTNEFI